MESEFFKKLSTESVLKGKLSPVAQAFVGLCVAGWSVAPDSTMSGELSIVGYMRQPVQWTDFTSSMSNSVTVSWNVQSAWPPIFAAFVADSSQGGKVLLFDSIPSQTFHVGDIAVIEVGNLVIL